MDQVFGRTRRCGDHGIRNAAVVPCFLADRMLPRRRQTRIATLDEGQSQSFNHVVGEFEVEDVEVLGHPVGVEFDTAFEMLLRHSPLGRLAQRAVAVPVVGVAVPLLANPKRRLSTAI